MAEKRPYFSSTIRDLESLFQQHKADPEKLAEIRNELLHRTRPRAKELLARINDLIGPIQELHFSLPQSQQKGTSKKREKNCKRKDNPYFTPDGLPSRQNRQPELLPVNETSIEHPDTPVKNRIHRINLEKKTRTESTHLNRPRPKKSLLQFLAGIFGQK